MLVKYNKDYSGFNFSNAKLLDLFLVYTLALALHFNSQQSSMLKTYRLLFVSCPIGWDFLLLYRKIGVSRGSDVNEKRIKDSVRLSETQANGFVITNWVSFSHPFRI